MAVEFVPIKSLEEGIKLLKASIEAGHVCAAFGEPVKEGERTVITAAEVSHGLGYGVGGGYGEGEPVSEDKETEAMRGGGGGGGGGAGAFARPVAAIIIEPQGVRVEPIVDVTKVVLAFFTMFGSMLMMLGQMHKAAK